VAIMQKQCYWGFTNYYSKIDMHSFLVNDNMQIKYMWLIKTIKDISDNTKNKREKIKELEKKKLNDAFI